MKKNKIILLMVTTFCLVFSGLYFLPVQAETVGDVQLVNPLGGTDDKPEGVTNINILLGNVVGQVLKILGSLALVAFVVGGFLWLTSAGNAEKVKSGTNTMLYAIIGLFVIFASYAILNTVLNGLTTATEESTSSGGAVTGSSAVSDTSNKTGEVTNVLSGKCEKLDQTAGDNYCSSVKFPIACNNGIGGTNKNAALWQKICKWTGETSSESDCGDLGLGDGSCTGRCTYVGTFCEVLDQKKSYESCSTKAYCKFIKN